MSPEIAPHRIPTASRPALVVSAFAEARSILMSKRASHANRRRVLCDALLQAAAAAALGAAAVIFAAGAGKPIIWCAAST
jgi:hypothetical protein